MNGADTVTLVAGAVTLRVRFLGAGAAAGLPPFVGAFEITPAGGSDRPQTVRVGLGLNFLWAADAALDADEAAERIMRTVGLLCIESFLAGNLKPDKQGILRIRDFIGTRYPDYTSVERFVTSLYDPPGRIARMCREDVLRCLAAHAGQARPAASSGASPEEPTGPGLALTGILVWPLKRRFYSDENVRDALASLEVDGLTDHTGERIRLRPSRMDDVRAMLE